MYHFSAIEAACEKVSGFIPFSSLKVWIKEEDVVSDSLGSYVRSEEAIRLAFEVAYKPHNRNKHISNAWYEFLDLLRVSDRAIKLFIDSIN